MKIFDPKLTGSIEIQSQVSGSIVPTTTEVFDLGSSTKRWNDIYLAGSTIDLGGTKMTKDASGNIEFKDGSNNRKKIIVEEILLGTGANQKRIKVDDGKLSTTDKDGNADTQLAGHIFPHGHNLYDLGSPTAQWRDLYLSSGSLYIDGTQVLSSTSNVLTVSTDAGQSLKLLETGADDITLQTDTGNIELKGTVEILSGKKIIDSAGTKLEFGDSLDIAGSIALTGTVDGIDLQSMSSSLASRINNLDTVYATDAELNAATASVKTFATSADTTLSSSLAVDIKTNDGRLDTLEGKTLVSSSAQLATAISGSNTAFSASVATRFEGLTTNYNELDNIPANIVSSSAQIATEISGSNTAFSASVSTRFEALTTDYTELDNIPANIISGSAQVTAAGAVMDSEVTSLALIKGLTAAKISGSFTSTSASLASTSKTNAGNISTNTSNISTNTSNISSNTSNITSINAATSSYLKNTTDTLTGNLTVTGTLTAQEFHTEIVSASVLFDSGSTKFGDSSDDVHNFTGSLNILSGSATIKGPGAGLTIHNSTNGGGSLIRFTDQGTGDQTGDITFYHSDGASQGGGASWHFVSEPDTVLVVGSSSVNGRFVAKSAGSAGEVDYGFYDDVNTGLLRTSADNVSLVAGGVRGVGVGTTAVTLKYAGSTKIATTNTGVSVTGGATIVGTNSFLIESNNTAATFNLNSSTRGFNFINNNATLLELSSAGNATFAGNLTIPEFIYHAGDTGTNIQMTSGKMILKNSGGKYINLHSNGIMYFDASAYQFYNGDATFNGHIKLSSGKALRLYNSAGNAWAEVAFNESDNLLQIQRGLVASSDSALNLGTNSVRWANVYADTYHGDGSSLTGRIGLATSASHAEFSDNSNLLDGQDSSYFTNASNIGSGTLNNSRLHAKVFVNDGGTFSDGFASDVDDVVGFRTLRVTGFTGTDHRAFTDHHNMITIPNTSSTQYDAQLAFQTGTVSQGGLKYRSSTDGTWGNWYKIWHEGNDGPTSGLAAQTAATATSASHAEYADNAGTLGGVNPGSFIRSDAADTTTGVLTMSSVSSIPLKLINGHSSYTAISIANTGSGDAGIYMDASNGDLAGSDYAFVGQTDDKDLKIHVGSSGGDIKFEESGGESMRIKDGKVGIGTTNPGSRLTVSGTNNATSEITLINTNPSTDNDWSITPFYNDQTLRFRTNSAATTVMTLKDNGNVGIGDTNPTSTLQVNDYVVGSNGDQNVYGEVSIFANSGTQSLFLGIKNAAYPNRGWAFNPVTSGVNSDLQIQEHGSSAVRMTLKSGGNVGIGTTSPSKALHIKSGNSDQLLIENGTSSGEAKIIFKANSNRNAGPFIKATQRGGSASDSDLRLGDENGDLMTLNANNVGIGTTSPTHKLHVAGTTSHTTVKVSTTTHNANFEVKTNNSNFAVIGQGSSNRFDIWDSNAGATRLSVASTGNVGIGTTNPSAKLDINGTGTFRGNLDIYKSNAKFTVTSTGASEQASVDAKNGSLHARWILDSDDLLRVYNQTSAFDAFAVKSSGNVGIGHAGPNSRLDVRRAGNGIALELHQTSGNADDYVDLKMIAGNTSSGTLGTILRHERQGSSGGDFAILTNPTLTGTPVERFRISKDGPATFAKDLTLTDGTLTVNDGNNYVKISEGSNSIGQIELKDSAPVFVQGWGTDFRVAVGTYNNHALTINSSKAATFAGKITAGGGVQYTGGNIAQATTVLHTNNVLYTRGGSAGHYLQNADGSEGIFLANDHVRIDTGGTERMRIKSDGKVGIGTSTPTVPLHVEPDSNYDVLKLGNDTITQYKVSGQTDHTVTLTCTSYYQAEIVVTANQTNGGTYNNLYVRGIWSNNHESHHWDVLEEVGSLTGTSISFTVSENTTSNSGKLIIFSDYNNGSFSQMVVRVTEYFGTHAYTIS